MNGIGFKNMKVFKERQWFDFKPITLLTGTNNSGKSSVINAMQMLQQNLPNNYKNTIDSLIQTKFRLQSNQNKYGSIDNFAHRDANNQSNHFVFARRNNNIQYNILVEINNGIDSYGQVKIIKAIDSRSEETAFSLEIIERNPKLICRYRINYKYFIDKFRLKCKNTIELHEEKIKLMKLTDLVNEKKEPKNKLINLADQISKKFQVYVDIFDTVGLDDKYEIKKESKTEFMITDSPYISDYEFTEIEEFGVLFENEKNRQFQTTANLMPTNKILEFFNKGIFDFDEIFKTITSDEKLFFDNLISDFYKTNRNEGYEKLNDDLIDYLSNLFWEVEEIYSEEDPLLVPNDLIKTYLNCHPDFGLIASCIGIKRNNNENYRKNLTSNKIPNDFLIANSFINETSNGIEKEVRDRFIKEIFEKLQSIIYNNKIDSKNRESYIFKEISEAVAKEFEQKMFNINIGLDNIFVSSTRFEQKRSYNLNDNSDFSALIRKIESSENKIREDCFSFINKWLKEFEIAEEIILKPDSETGNFKTYLKINGQNHLLADFGLGTNQLLPVIFSLGLHTFKTAKYYPYEIVLSEKTVVIEEPEANLHPAMQSKLADLFVDAYKKFKIQVIVETHSEYLIRKLQYLVGSSKSDIKPKDVSIYYFYKANHPAVISKEVNQVEKIEIDEFGRLSKEFGTGFFDEADKIALDIFLLKQSQSN